MEMEGINELKQSVEALGPIEKDLDSPIMIDNNPAFENEENSEMSVESSDYVLLSKDELNRPLTDPDTIENVGLPYELKQEIKEQTEWSENILDYIRTEEEAQVYMDANLKEVNGNLERTDIDWNAEIPCNRIERMRSVHGDDVADKWSNRTNIDLIKEGNAPYGSDGEQINLHHIGQKADSPLAELTNTEHKHNDGILHDKQRPSEIERPVFRAERIQYWQNRYESLQEK